MVVSSIAYDVIVRTSNMQNKQTGVSHRATCRENNKVKNFEMLIAGRFEMRIAGRFEIRIAGIAGDYFCDFLKVRQFRCGGVMCRYATG